MSSKKSKKLQENTATKQFALSKKIIIVAVIVALIATVSIVTCATSTTRTIAFYGISESQISGLKTIITEICEKEHLSFEYVVLDSEKRLENQIPLSRKPQILFTTAGYPLESALDIASKKGGVEPELTAGMTSSVRSAVRYLDLSQKIIALPIVTSHYEVDIETAAFRNSGMRAINTWKDVEDFLKIQKRRVEYPIVFAGSDSDTFLDMIGAFCESIEGADAYEQAVDILSEGAKHFDAIKLAKELCDNPDSPLITTVRMLSSWYKNGFIHPGTFSFKNADVEAFAQSKLSSVLFMPLEQHRVFNQEAISRFTSIYFPSSRTASSRVFTGKMIYAIPMIKSKDAETLVSHLVQKEYQEDLSRASGLAPVLAQCRTPDKQADDARYWIAATTAPLAGLSSEVYLSKEQKTKLSAEIAAKIRYGN